MITYTIRPGGVDDLAVMLALRREAERWLARNGITQWTPDYDEYARSVLAASVAAGTAWIVVDDSGQSAATVGTARLDQTPDPDFWGWLDPGDQGDALYLHKMIVSRSHAGDGLGEAILNWASQRAADAGRSWVRIDVRRDNERLQRYYLDRCFQHLRVYHHPRRRTESGWLAQRPAGTLTPCPIQLIEAGG